MLSRMFPTLNISRQEQQTKEKGALFKPLSPQSASHSNGIDRLSRAPVVMSLLFAKGSS